MLVAVFVAGEWVDSVVVRGLDELRRGSLDWTDVAAAAGLREGGAGTDRVSREIARFVGVAAARVMVGALRVVEFTAWAAAFAAPVRRAVAVDADRVDGRNVAGVERNAGMADARWVEAGVTLGAALRAAAGSSRLAPARPMPTARTAHPATATVAPHDVTTRTQPMRRV